MFGRFTGTWMVLAVLFVGLCLYSSANCAETKSVLEMTHGEFALYLVGIMEAEGLLSEAAVANDAIAFWEDVGIEPSGGWQADKMLRKDDLKSMLGSEEDLSIDELLDLLKARLLEILWARSGLREPVSPIAL